MTQKHIGSSLDDLLLKDGTYENVTTAAVKRVLARQLGAAMAEQDVSKTDMAKRMKTSRAQLNRLLDPNNAAVTLETLQRAAAAVGRQVRLELV
jgi:DNA-binding Xre family transcriptional regulator